MAKKKQAKPAPVQENFIFYPPGAQQNLENRITIPAKHIAEKYVKSQYYKLSLVTKYLSPGMYFRDFLNSDMNIEPEIRTTGKLWETVKFHIEKQK